MREEKNTPKCIHIANIQINALQNIYMFVWSYDRSMDGSIMTDWLASDQFIFNTLISSIHIFAICLVECEWLSIIIII